LINCTNIIMSTLNKKISRTNMTIFLKINHIQMGQTMMNWKLLD
jgi:hypothetical protein